MSILLVKQKSLHQIREGFYYAPVCDDDDGARDRSHVTRPCGGSCSDAMLQTLTLRD